MGSGWRIVSSFNFASLFPFTIGGIGAIEGVATAYLVSLVVPGHEALAMVVIQHGLQFLLTTGVGGIIYFQGRWYNVPLIKSETRRMSSDREQNGEIDLLTETKKRLDELSVDLHLEPKFRRETSLSIVIPVFNEQTRLPKTILETIRWCRDHQSWYELIIVDDGSTDDTLEIARLFSLYDDNVKVLACPHTGKGAAVRMGMLNAAGTCILFMDADLATPLSEIPKLLTKIHDGYGIAIGSRVAQTEGEATVKAVFYRKFVGRIFAGMVNIFAIKGIGDTQCGFKVFRGDIVKDVFGRQKLVGYAFDVEILYVAEKLGIPIAEVSVNWNHQPGSKVNVVIDGFKMLRDTLRIRFLHVDLPRTHESILVKTKRTS